MTRINTTPDEETRPSCEVCEDSLSIHIMYPVSIKGRDYSKPVYMCDTCSWQAYEAGTHESDE